MDLYKAYLDKKRKKIESHTAALEKASIETNNALVVYNANPPIDTKNLNVSIFFEDHNWEIGHLIGGGVVGTTKIIKFYFEKFFLL